MATGATSLQAAAATEAKMARPRLLLASTCCAFRPGNWVVDWWWCHKPNRIRATPMGSWGAAGVRVSVHHLSFRGQFHRRSARN
jgi:hypothetical protein